MFSKSCEYGIKAAIFISEKALLEERVSLKDVSTAISSPTAFTAKILQRLAKSGLVQSIKGNQGGYTINLENIDDINLWQIVKAIEGEHAFEGCALGLTNCNHNKPCPMHDKMTLIRQELIHTLQATTLKHLATALSSGLVFLKN